MKKVFCQPFQNAGSDDQFVNSSRKFFHRLEAMAYAVP